MTELGELTEPVITTCPLCRLDVTSHWMRDNTGCISRPTEYVLVADWIVHASCWDKMMEQHPP